METYPSPDLRSDQQLEEKKQLTTCLIAKLRNAIDDNWAQFTTSEIYDLIAPTRV